MPIRSYTYNTLSTVHFYKSLITILANLQSIHKCITQTSHSYKMYLLLIPIVPIPQTVGL